MGIKGLKKYLIGKYPHLERKENMYKFRGCKIAIDVSILGYKYWSPMQNRIVNKITDPTEDLDVSAITKLWLENIWKFMSKLLVIGVTPVMVFDGKPPSEKLVIADRRSERAAGEKAINDFKEEMKRLDPLSRTKEHLQRIKKMYYSWNALSGEQFSLLKVFFTGLGLPVLQAVHEAEALCCELCRKGLVSAVYSNDIDCLAHGATCWIYEKTEEKEFVPERKEYIEKFEFMFYDEVLKATNLTEEMFIDLCIMCGCDYNSNIKNIGPSKSHGYIKNYGNIEKLSGTLDISVYRHLICRELFSRKDYSVICTKPDYKLEIDKKCVDEYSREYLMKCEMEHLVQHLDFIYATFPNEYVQFKDIFLNSQNIKVDVSTINMNSINIGSIDISDIDFSKLNIQ